MQTSSADSRGSIGKTDEYCDVWRVTCIISHLARLTLPRSERRHLYNVVQRMSGAVRYIVRLRNLDHSSPLKSPRRVPVSDRQLSNSIIHIPAGSNLCLLTCDV